MVRQARIDLPGHLYHVLGRGIEQRDIFVDHKDYTDFLTRLEEGLNRTGSKCFAFCLLPNHFHLLILRGHRPLAELMRRLMTGYAVRFNLRYNRSGHLFQNRYKAILCDRDSYFLELIAYIHLNPLRAGFVHDLRGLRKYKWCGHSTLVGENIHKFLAIEDILSEFGSHLRSAMRRYESFVSDRASKFNRGDLSRGGLMKSKRETQSRGDQELMGKEKTEISDERILGSGLFVESVLRRVESMQNRKVPLEEVIEQVEKKSGVKFEEIASKSQARHVVKARALYCHLAKECCGVSGAHLMRQLNLTSGAISHLVYKGRDLTKG